jgi:hypothetical protein
MRLTGGPAQTATCWFLAPGAPANDVGSQTLRLQAPLSQPPGQRVSLGVNEHTPAPAHVPFVNVRSVHSSAQVAACEQAVSVCA